MKKSFLYLFLGLFLTPLEAQVTPAVAANMKFAFQEIADAFTKKTNIKVTPVYGSSGKLVTQIRNGAPFDIFISADIGFADSVVKSKLAIGKPQIYAYGKLVLWTMKSIDLTKGSSFFSNSSVKSIALGDIKLTVYGPAAKSYLEKENLWTSVEPKIVYGENISKVAQFIVSGAADIGFCAKSIVLSDEMKGKGTWVEIDYTKYDPLPQAAVVLSYGKDNNSKSTEALYAFLYSQEAKIILLDFGYTVP